MKVVILCGGKGTRLGFETKIIPKPIKYSITICSTRNSNCLLQSESYKSPKAYLL